jgi:hypothetical protein
MELDIKSNLTISTLVANGTYATDAKSTPVNISPYIGNLVVLADIGAPTSSPNSTLGVWIQTTGTINADSLEAPSETAWHAAGTFAQATTAATQEAISLDTRGLSKWVRSNMDFGGFASGVRAVSIKMIGQKSVV